METIFEFRCRLQQGTLDLEDRITRINEGVLERMTELFWEKANKVIEDRGQFINLIIAYRGGFQKIEYEKIKAELKWIEVNWQHEIYNGIISEDREQIYRELWGRCVQRLYTLFNYHYYNVPREMRRKAKEKALRKRPFESFLTKSQERFKTRSQEERDADIKTVKNLDKVLLHELMKNKFEDTEKLIRLKEEMTKRILANLAFLNGQINQWIDSINFAEVGSEGLPLDLYLFSN